MKPLCLLSFSFAFLAQGVANDFAYEDGREQYRDEEYEDDYNQGIGFDDDDYLSDAEPSYTPVQSQYTSEPDVCHSPYHRMHFSARHNEKQGIGYHDGYTTLEAFGIYDGWSSHFMPFLDLRGHVFNNGKLAGNVGIGERTVISSWSHTFGSYLYYDVRQVGHGLTINQLSPGLELVGRRMEYRINGYFPVSRDKTHKYGYKFDEFEGNNIILKSKQQRALRGGDAEVGVHITQSTKYDLYAAAGPYYIHAPHAHSWGGRTRLLGRYKEYVALEVAYSYDNLFRSIVQGSVAITVPFGRKLKRTGEGCPQGNDLLLSRASFAPSRFEIPVVKRIHRKEKAINPATGRPWTVWFVDNTSSSSGTIKSPFPTLLQAQNASSANDMIYVFPGDGSAKGMDAGIALKDGQSLFGSGIKHKIATTKGSLVIPAMSSTNPSIATSFGNTIALANGNVISGFNILIGGNGIQSFPNPINGATISNNNILIIMPSLAISILGTGPVNIYDNQIVGSPAINASAINVEAVGGVMSGSISNNFISLGNSGISLVNTTSSGSYDMTIQGNTIANFTNNFGIFVNMKGASTVDIIENVITATNSGGIPIHVQDVTSTTSGNVSISNNQFVASFPGAGSYIALEVPLSSPNGTNLDVAVTNNTMSTVRSSGVGSFNFSSGATDTMCLTLNDNVATGGFNLTTTGSGIINVDSIEGNVGGPIATAGNVNFVPEGVCNN